MAVPCCVFSSKGPSLSLSLSLSHSPCPSLLLLKCVISPSHHHRASKNCAPIDFFFSSSNSRLGSDESLQERKNHQKRAKGKRKRKRDQDARIPRNVSTFLAGEKATPAVRLSCCSLHKAYMCTHTHAHTNISYIYIYIYIYIYSS